MVTVSHTMCIHVEGPKNLGALAPCPLGILRYWPSETPPSRHALPCQIWLL